MTDNISIKEELLSIISKMENIDNNDLFYIKSDLINFLERNKNRNLYFSDLEPEKQVIFESFILKVLVFFVQCLREQEAVQLLNATLPVIEQNRFLKRLQKYSNDLKVLNKFDSFYFDTYLQFLISDVLESSSTSEYLNQEKLKTPWSRFIHDFINCDDYASSIWFLLSLQNTKTSSFNYQEVSNQTAYLVAEYKNPEKTLDDYNRLSLLAKKLIDIREHYLKHEMLIVLSYLKSSIYKSEDDDYVYKVLYDSVKHAWSNLSALQLLRAIYYRFATYFSLHLSHTHGSYLPCPFLHLKSILKNIKKRHSDETELFRLFLGINQSSNNQALITLPENTEGNDFSSEILSQVDKLIDSLNSAGSDLKPEPNLKQSVNKNLVTKERLDFQAMCLENRYSNERANHFKPPIVRLEHNSVHPTELLLLRKWGSTAPLLPFNRKLNAVYGGGYFLIHNGFGLAIDPGPDFLRNLCEYSDFDIYDIHGVVFTHCHQDHFLDFQRILTCIIEINRFFGHRKLYYYFPKSLDKNLLPKELITTEEKVFFDLKEFPDPSTGENYVLFPPPDNSDKFTSIEDGIRIRTFETWHQQFPSLPEKWHCPTIFSENLYNSAIKSEEKYCKKNDMSGKNDGEKFKIIDGIKYYNPPLKNRYLGHGLVIEPLRKGLPVATITFTGDTEYITNLSKIPDSSVVIADIGSVRSDDLFRLDPSNIDFHSKNKRNHLGYSGMLKLANHINHSASCLILEEFFEPQSRGDFRLPLIHSLNEDLKRACPGTKCRIFAGESGVRLRFPGENKVLVYCDACQEKWKFVNIEDCNQIKKTLYDRLNPILFQC